MSYPEPIKFESQERLYEQAMFFWKEYERVKATLEKVMKIDKKAMDKSAEASLIQRRVIDELESRVLTTRQEMQEEMEENLHRWDEIKILQDKITKMEKALMAYKQFADHLNSIGYTVPLFASVLDRANEARKVALDENKHKGKKVKK